MTRLNPLGYSTATSFEVTPMRARITALSVLVLATRSVLGGSVITANLPANNAIVNIDARADGAGTYGAAQDQWYQPFGGPSGLLQYTIQPGTYSFQLTNPSLAVERFPALTSGQLSQIYTAWTYNSPWVTDYMVFDSAAATNPSLPQLFSGAITPTSDYPGYSSASVAFNTARTKGFADQIVDSPLGRHWGTKKTRRTFTAPQTLIFIVPDNGLSDNTGGVSVVISPIGTIPGDYNQNNILDAGDYIVWRKGGPLANEAVTIGSTTSEDYTYWRNRFGNILPTSGAGGSLSLSTVPEPESAVLVMSALWTATLWKRPWRKNKRVRRPQLVQPIVFSISAFQTL